MRRRPLLLALVAAAGVSATLAFGLPALVTHAARSAAAQRGFDAEIGSVSIRPTRVWLHDVRLRHRQVEGFRARLQAIELRFAWRGIRALTVHGGEVRLKGDRQALLEQLRGLRSARAGTANGSGQEREVTARGLYLEWRDSNDRVAHVWGLSLRRQQGALQLDADLLRANHRVADVEMAALSAKATLPELALSDLTAARTEIRLSLGEGIARSSQPATDLTSPTPKAQAGASESQRRTANASRGVLPAAFSYSPGRGERLRARLEAVSGVLARRLPVGGRLQLDGVFVVMSHGQQRLNLGPARLTGLREAEQMRFNFSPGAARDGQQLEFELTLPVGDGSVALSVGGGPIALSELGVREGDFGLTGVSRAKVELRLDGELSGGGKVMELSSRGALSNVSLAHPKVAPDELTDIALAWSGKGSLSLDGSKVLVSEAELRFGAVQALGHLDLERDARRLVVDANLEVPSASCQDMFDSLPTAIVPLLQGARFRGDFSWKGSLLLDTDRLSDTKVKWRMKNRCRIVSVPKEADPERFTEPFSRTVPSPEGVPLMVWSGPGSVDWVPLEQISHYLEVGVLTTEDGGFWGHAGFDQGAIEGSIKQNLEAGKFVRGASTITMQLAKNLYLSREKHLSRKVQEALLTMLLEQELTKGQILELYFNVIEFGPDIWGIGMAADHYFHSDPKDLSIAQCFFLAALLPNPLAQYFEEDGSLKSSRRALLQRLMRIAHGRGRLSAAELEEGLAQEVQFGVPHLRPDQEYTEEGEFSPPDWQESDNLDER